MICISLPRLFQKISNPEILKISPSWIQKKWLTPIFVGFMGIMAWMGFGGCARKWHEVYDIVPVVDNDKRIIRYEEVKRADGEGQEFLSRIYDFAVYEKGGLVAVGYGKFCPLKGKNE